MEQQRDYYKIMIVGASGKGKTYMFNNMDPETTGFINVEDKPLPFANRFKYHKRVTNYQEVLSVLVDYAKNPEINCIIVDSFSAYLESLVSEARKTKKGFDVWFMVAEEIGRFATLIKRIQKEVFVTAHYEVLNIEGSPEKRIKTKGKEYEGLIEKDYTMVLYADNKFNEKGKPEYFLQLVGEGTSAKCPPGIFEEDLIIPNDGKYILDNVIKFATNK